MTYFKLCFILALFFVGCKKENKTTLDYSEISSGTNFNLRCIYKFNNDTLFAGGGDDSHGIILISSNQGASWQVYSQSFFSRVNAVYFRNAMEGFAACNNFLLMKTNDGGVHWDSIVQYWVPYQYQTNLYDVKFINDSTGFFCGGEEYGHGIIGRTTDGGQTWEYTFVDHEMRSVDFKNNLQGYCGGYGAMLYTEDGGKKWQLTESNNEFITSIRLTASNGVACGYDGGLLRNVNSLNWEKTSSSNHSLGSRLHFNSVSTFDNTNYFVFGNNGKCALSTDAGSEWHYATAFDEQNIFDAVMLTSFSGIAVGEHGKIFHFNK